MLRHRKTANAAREQIGRGPFAYGPKVTSMSVDKFEFDSLDSLEGHATDDDSSEQVPLQAGSPTNVVPPPHPPSEHFPLQPTTDIGNPGIMRPHEGTSSRIVSNDTPGMRSSCDAAILAPASNPPNVSTVDDMNQLDPSNTDDVANVPFGAQTSLQGGPYPHQHTVETDVEDEADEEADDFSELLTLVDGSDEDRHHCGSETLTWIRENKGWVDLYYNHGLTIAAMDDILKLLNAPCKSWKTVRSNIVESTNLYSSLKQYQTCPGHMCFATSNGKPQVVECSVCGKEKPSDQRANAATSVTYIPLVPRIRSMIEIEGRVDQLYDYRHSRSASNEYMRDYFDSAGYEELCRKYGGESKLRYDIFLSASTDGFQAVKNNSCDVCPIVGILFNLPPHQRSSVKNVMPLMFIPHDVEPRDLQSFLIPLVNEIERTHTQGGIKIHFPDGVERKVRIHLISFTTDLAALVKIGGVNGVNGRRPCRFCWMEGVCVQESRHYYFVSWLHPERNGESRVIYYNLRYLRLRSERDTEDVYKRLEAAQTATQRREIATETGIKERSVLCSLPSMTPFHCFPPDIMHLMYNVQKELLHHHLSGSADGFAVPQNEIDFLEEELMAFGGGISGQVAPRPKRLSRFTSWKAADHKAFTLAYALVIFDGYLSEQCMNGLQCFFQLAEICFRPSVSKREAREAKNLAVRFVENFENEYVRHDPKRASFCKYVIHLLLHLGDELVYSGPLVCSSQYPMEGYIGWIVDRCNARYLPAKSMLLSALFGGCYKSFYKIAFDKSDSGEELLDAEGQFLGPKEDVSVADLENGGVRFRSKNISNASITGWTHVLLSGFLRL